MSMSIEQAKAIVQSTGGQTYGSGGTTTTWDTGSGGGSGPLDPGGGLPSSQPVIPQNILDQLWAQSNGDVGTFQQLVNQWVATNGALSALYGAMPPFLQNSGVQTDPYHIVDPTTRQVYILGTDSKGNPQWNQMSITDSKAYLASLGYGYDPTTGSPNGSPGNGSSSDNLQAQLGYDYANLAENRRQFDIQNALAQQQANQGYVQNRATTGLNLGDLVRNLANDQYNRALNPGNYPAYLAASAGLPQGTSSPIDALLGQGVQISAPAGGNPLADPRFQQLLDQEYGYAQPQGLQTVQNIAAQNGGQLPQSFYDYTHTQNPNAAPVPAHATGGMQMLHEPVIGIGLHSGMPKFLAGEAGPERLDFTPVHQHESQGMPVPHAHAQGDVQHDHTGPNAQPTFKGYAMGGAATAGDNTAGQPNLADVYGGGQGAFTPHQLIAAYNAYHPNAQMADNVYTPAEATNMSIGKQLQTLGYVPQSVVQQYMNGTTATPGSFSEDWFARLPASIQQLMQAGIQAQLGTAGLEDFNQRLQQFQMPTSIGTRPGVAYQ